MPNHIRRITRWLAAPLALFIVRRRYVTAAEIHKAIAEHNEALRTHEPMQAPVGTYGLLTGQHWD